jgi:hypothetical protein
MERVGDTTTAGGGDESQTDTSPVTPSRGTRCVDAHPQTLDGVRFLVGKVLEDRYNVDYGAPLSHVQAFALALMLVEPSISEAISKRNI